MSVMWMLPEEVQNYMHQHRQQGVFDELRQATKEAYRHKQNKRKFPKFNPLRHLQADNSWMMISTDMVNFLQSMTRLSRAKRCLDLGTFTGTSALAMASSLAEDGVVVSCDINSQAMAMAKRYWQKAALAHKIKGIVQPARQVMEEALASGEMFDLIFFDCQDRRHYHDYYELALKLCSPGGVLIFDNAFMFGHVMDKSSQHVNGRFIADFNEKVLADRRVHANLLPFADGVLFLIKSSATG